MEKRGNYHKKKLGSIYHEMVQAMVQGRKQLAVLLDPEKIDLNQLPQLISMIEASPATHIFVGGSTDGRRQNGPLINTIKPLTSLPVVIFPGDPGQISPDADGLLFLSLVSGRNPEYLIGKHVEAVKILRTMDLEVVPTAYLLIENGTKTAVQRVSQTDPLSLDDVQLIVDTAKAAELLGMKCVYLEAGSGAQAPVAGHIIQAVKQEVEVPLIVGGGIKSVEQLKEAYRQGADMVVIGTVFEQNPEFLNELNKANGIDFFAPQ